MDMHFALSEHPYNGHTDDYAASLSGLTEQECRVMRYLCVVILDDVRPSILHDVMQQVIRQASSSYLNGYESVETSGMNQSMLVEVLTYLESQSESQYQTPFWELADKTARSLLDEAMAHAPIERKISSVVSSAIQAYKCHPVVWPYENGSPMDSRDTYLQ